LVVEGGIRDQGEKKAEDLALRLFKSEESLLTPIRN
jgi:hypothetical protein